jgi:hypothetical protein
MIKIKEIYIPAAKKLAKRLQTPEAIDLIVDLSELTLALSTITVTPYISVMGALTILYKIKDNPIISEHLPKFREIMINLEKLERSLNNFKNAFSRKNRRQKMVLDNEEYMAAKEG